MTNIRMVMVLLMGIALCAGATMAADVSMKISGPGAVDDTTIKVGEPVLVDIYWSNDKDGRRGFTTGFKISSGDIKKIVHVADSGNGLNPLGDIKGYNGWENSEVWDFAGIWPAIIDWDGQLPDLVGFGGAVIKKFYDKHEELKVLSWEMIIPDPGTIVIDSSFFPPGGYWKFGSGEKPVWHGPYTFKVVK